MKVPLKFKWNAVGSAASSIMQRGSTNLIVDGAVTVNSTTLGDVKIPYKGEVEVVLQ